MVIDLTHSVELRELGEISVKEIVGAEKASSVEFSFSKEALIGFATELIWLYEDINKERKISLCTDPLGGTPSGNNVIGFYTTSNSPRLVLQINSLKYETLKENHKCKEIVIKERYPLRCLKTEEPVDDNYSQQYELGSRNILEIKVFNKDLKDITFQYYTVILKLNYKAIKSLANMLFILADNYVENCDYSLAKQGEKECGYNMGIVLTEESLPTRFRCCSLGCVYDYESDFGIPL